MGNPVERWPTLLEYLRLWANHERDPRASQGEPDAPSCRWCRLEGKASAGRTRHNGAYWCNEHDGEYV